MKITVPQPKMSNLKLRIKQAKIPQPRSCRWVAALLGKMTSMIPAIGEALLHIRYIQRDLSMSLMRNRHNWEGQCLLSQKSKEDLEWWEHWAQTKNGLPIHPPTPPAPQMTIYVDASDTGWGVKSETIETAGHWTPAERENSINVRELKTILFALQMHGNAAKNQTIKILSDSMTALKYVRKAGGTSSPLLQDLALQIQEITNQFNLTVLYEHIPGVKNIDADRLSRIKTPLYEWKLPHRWFKKIQKTWGRCRIDAFAARHNTQLPLFWSHLPDPAATATDAFRQTWPKRGLFLHPPWNLIPKVLHQFRQQRVAEAILVTPWWTTQFWFPMILQLTNESPILMPINRKWTLAAWRLSRNAGKQRA